MTTGKTDALIRAVFVWVCKQRPMSVVVEYELVWWTLLAFAKLNLGKA